MPHIKWTLCHVVGSKIKVELGFDAWSWMGHSASWTISFIPKFTNHQITDTAPQYLHYGQSLFSMHPGFVVPNKHALFPHLHSYSPAYYGYVVPSPYCSYWTLTARKSERCSGFLALKSNVHTIARLIKWVLLCNLCSFWYARTKMKTRE